MYRQICLHGQLLRSRAFSYCVLDNGHLENPVLMGTRPASHLKESHKEWLDPETATWNNSGGWGTPQKQPFGTMGGGGHTPETATCNSRGGGIPQKQPLGTLGWGDTPHLLVCTPTETAHPGREDFTNHQLRRRTGGKDKRTEQGEMLFCLLAFISTFSEAFIHFYILFYKEWDMYFSNHCISGVPRFFFLILSF